MLNKYGFKINNRKKNIGSLQSEDWWEYLELFCVML